MAPANIGSLVKRGTEIVALQQNSSLCLISAFMWHPVGVSWCLFSSPWDSSNICFHSRGIPTESAGSSSHHPIPVQLSTIYRLVHRYIHPPICSYSCLHCYSMKPTGRSVLLSKNVKWKYRNHLPRNWGLVNSHF